MTLSTEKWRHHMINRIFFGCKKSKISLECFLDIFLILAENIDCGVLTSTHNLRFGALIRKIGMPLHTPVFLFESGV